jgi:hypothetical protein
VEEDSKWQKIRLELCLMFGDDGGGSLSTVVDIAGLFIEQALYCTNQISRKKKRGSIR